jgi:hypothetical protein
MCACEQIVILVGGDQKMSPAVSAALQALREALAKPSQLTLKPLAGNAPPPHALERSLIGLLSVVLDCAAPAGSTAPVSFSTRVVSAEAAESELSDAFVDSLRSFLKAPTQPRVPGSGGLSAGVGASGSRSSSPTFFSSHNNNPPSSLPPLESSESPHQSSRSRSASNAGSRRNSIGGGEGAAHPQSAGSNTATSMSGAFSRGSGSRSGHVTPTFNSRRLALNPALGPANPSRLPAVIGSPSNANPMSAEVVTTDQTVAPDAASTAAAAAAADSSVLTDHTDPAAGENTPPRPSSASTNAASAAANTSLSLGAGGPSPVKAADEDDDKRPEGSRMRRRDSIDRLIALEDQRAAIEKEIAHEKKVALGM